MRLAGIAGAAWHAAEEQTMGYRRGPILLPLILITLGIVFLSSNLTGGTLDLGDFIARWWPVLLILIGLEILISAAWRPGSVESDLALDLAGAQQASVRIQFGAGTLTVGRAAAGKLVDGRFAGGVRHEAAGGRVTLAADPGAWGWSWGTWAPRFAWRVGLTGEVPLALLVEMGACRADLDLSDLRLNDLQLKTGASDTRIALPRAAGQTNVRLESGAASLNVVVPAGVAARIRSTMALGSTTVDQARFPRAADGAYASPDFATAVNRAEIQVSGGVGSVTVG